MLELGPKAPHFAGRGGVFSLSLTKGLEIGSRLRMTEVVNDVLPDHPAGCRRSPRQASASD